MNRDLHVDSLQALVRFFETLTKERVAALPGLYAPDAYFKDPFNEVHSVSDIERIFTHMFAQVEAPRFVVTDAVHQEDQAFLIWIFHFRSRGRKGRPFSIRGSSHLRFGPDGRVVYHRDYWDAAEELYARIPMLGWWMRALKSKLQAR